MITVYVPNGKSVDHEDFRRKLDWLSSLRDFIDGACDPAEPLILCGDFNLCPEGLDSWNEKELAGTIFHTDEERTAFAGLLSWGWCDLFREARPEERAFSWWDYRGGAFHRGRGLRLDFLLATETVRQRVTEVFIDRDYRRKVEGHTPSDHAPVVADID
jgi:exodeoxyribonuclease-3